MTKYKDKNTDELKDVWEIRKELKEFISNNNEFNEYINNEEAYIKEYYTEVEE